MNRARDVDSEVEGAELSWRGEVAGSGVVESPGRATTSLFRSAELEECLEGDGRAIATVVEKFMADFGEYLERFEATLQAEDGDLLAGAAHAARGACLLIGIPALENLCLGLERAGGRRDFEAARGDLDSARTYWASQSLELARYIETLLDAASLATASRDA